MELNKPILPQKSILSVTGALHEIKWIYKAPLGFKCSGKFGKSLEKLFQTFFRHIKQINEFG
jgi:hypothetical protein